jgi:hypothetical protein
MSDQGDFASYEDTRAKQSRYFDPFRELNDPRPKIREGWKQGLLPLAGLLASSQLYTGHKTKAPSPCWRDSTTKEVKWHRISKADAKEVYRQAEDFERQTRQPGRQDGRLGRNGLAVLRALLFHRLNYKTGQLDPGYKTIAIDACISIRSAARGLAALKTAGVVNWLRRCRPVIEAGRCILEQLSNAYAIMRPSSWLGYRPNIRVTKPTPPEAGTWGDHPPLPDAITAAAEVKQNGGCFQAVLSELETDSRDAVALQLARLGRAMNAREKIAASDVPALHRNTIT